MLTPIKKAHFEKFLQYQGITLLPYQWDLVDKLLEMPEYFKITQARQSGKSFILGLMCAYLIYQRKYKIGVFAPNRDATRHILQYTKKALIKILGYSSKKYNSLQVFSVELVQGGFVVGLSASPDAMIEGYTLDLAIIDEKQDCDNETIMNAITPMLSWTNGCMWAAGIGGIATSFGEQFEADVFICPWQNIVNHKEGYLAKVETARENMLPTHFGAHYECKSISDESVYLIPRILKLDNPRDYTIQPNYHNPQAYTNIYIACDYGKYKDKTVATVVGRYIEDDIVKFHIIDWLVTSGDYAVQLDTLVEFCNSYYYNYIYSERTGVGEALSDMLNKTLDGVKPVSINEKNKSNMLKKVSVECAAERVSYQSDKPLSRVFYNDITSQQCKYTSKDLIKVAKSGEKNHSDFLSSLILIPFGE